jgi:hypothetical protein
MNILDIYTAIQHQLSPIGLRVYKEVKPTSQKENCLVINSVPISKNNVNTVNDIIVFLYINKINSEFDFLTANMLFPQVSEALKDVIINNGLVTITEKLDANTLNLDDTWTVSEFTFRTITH